MFHHYPTVRWQSEVLERPVPGVRISYKITDIEQEPWRGLDERDLQDMADWTKAVEIGGEKSGFKSSLGDDFDSCRPSGQEGAPSGGPAMEIPDRKAFFVHQNVTMKVSLNNATRSANTNTGEECNDARTTPPAHFRQFAFEFLESRPRYTRERVQELLHSCPKRFVTSRETGAEVPYCSTDVGTKLLFENDICRVWDFYLEPDEGGTASTVHHHTLPYVSVNTEASRLLGYSAKLQDLQSARQADEALRNGNITVEAPVAFPTAEELKSLQIFDSISAGSQVTWTDIPEHACFDHDTYSHGGKNGWSEKPMREYLVELK